MREYMLKHVLIIPDGNRRYAEKKNIDMPVVYKLISDDITTKLIKYLIIDKNIKEMSFFAISRDNVLKRTGKDLDPILDAQVKAYEDWLKTDALTKNVTFKFIGDLDLLPKEYVKVALKLQEKTKKNKNGTLNILTAYDGRWEIREASKKAAEKNDLSENAFEKYLLIKTPIDLIIRTGGEKRFSTCPIYQSAYSELVFLDKFYPELTSDVLDGILKDYESRHRRFGK